MSAFHVVESTVDHAFGWAPGAALYVWRGKTTPEAAAAMSEMMGVVREQSGELPGVMLGVVEARTPPPDGETRKALAAALESGAGFVQASALAFEGEGFQAAMVRMVAAGLAMIARPPFPHQVFADVSSGAAWLEQRIEAVQPGACSAAALVEHMAALRRADHIAGT